jgi:glucosamine--fructose-6-phosphate aminotransferase (isomerizing)
MAAEVAEQPQVWRQLITEGADRISRVATAIAERSPRFVLFVARGTSDHAALYAKYLVEIVTIRRWPSADSSGPQHRGRSGNHQS